MQMKAISFPQFKLMIANFGNLFFFCSFHNCTFVFPSYYKLFSTRLKKNTKGAGCKVRDPSLVPKPCDLGKTWFSHLQNGGESRRKVEA
jgi:hypothetical protein